MVPPTLSARVKTSTPATASRPAIAKPEPTADSELEPAMISATATGTEPRITPEPEPDGTSD